MRTDVAVKDKSLGYAVKSEMVFKMPFSTIPIDGFTGKCDRVDYNIIYLHKISKNTRIFENITHFQIETVVQNLS